MRMSRLEWYCDDAEQDEPLRNREIHDHYIRKRYSSSNERDCNPQTLSRLELLGVERTLRQGVFSVLIVIKSSINPNLHNHHMS